MNGYDSMGGMPNMGGARGFGDVGAGYPGMGSGGIGGMSGIGGMPGGIPPGVQGAGGGGGFGGGSPTMGGRGFGGANAPFVNEMSLFKGALLKWISRLLVG